jgi:antitoxin ParD1/3/4
MATETLNISLPSPLRRYVEERVERGDYGNTSEYIRELIRKDREEQDRRTLEQVEAKVLAAIESIERGEWVEYTPDYWEKLRQRVRARQEGAPGAEE